MGTTLELGELICHAFYRDTKRSKKTSFYEIIRGLLIRKIRDE